MDALAIIMQKPGQIALERLVLSEPQAADVVVDIEYSGISTGTERLLWTGRMPQFPGMGYPLVPGYESVGRISAAGAASGMTAGDRVFVPGATCFGPVRGLFGGAASRLVVPASRTVKVDDSASRDAVLLALAATAKHVTSAPGAVQPDLIIGHGVLGRLIARLAVAAGHAPVVWETDAGRREGGTGYQVMDPTSDSRRDYRCICDASGASGLLDTLMTRLAPGGEIVLAGFYGDPLSFVFPPAFMREARIRVAAQWQPADLVAVRDLVHAGTLSLAGLVTHTGTPEDAAQAYETAFGDAGCLKMIIDWRHCT
jgi:bacteriochlorophyllide a dehydrogenase